MNIFTVITTTMLVLTYQADNRFEAIQQARADGYNIYAIK